MSRVRLKVVHVITRMVRGGAQLVVLDLLRGLDPGRFELHLISGDETGDEGSLWDAVDSLGIDVHRIPSLVRNVQPARDLKALREIRRTLRKITPDVVHAHTSKAGLIGCVAASRERVPAIVLAPHGHILAANARIPGVPRRGLKRWVLAGLARRSCRYAHVVVAPNDVERQDGIDHGLWSDDGSITIPNGVDTSLFSPLDKQRAREPLRWPRHHELYGVVARLSAEKGVDVAIHALACLATGQLIIVGDGPERVRLQSLAASLGLQDRVTFFGLSDRVHELIPAFDTLIVPSRTEAHGLVAAEGLACGVPVVSTCAGGLKSLVLHHQTGISVPVDDPAAIARAVQRLSVDATLRQALVRAGRNHIVAEFSREVMLERTTELYDSLCVAAADRSTDLQHLEMRDDSLELHLRPSGTSSAWSRESPD